MAVMSLVHVNYTVCDMLQKMQYLGTTGEHVTSMLSESIVFAIVYTVANIGL